MKIAVFGSTGKTGMQVVRQALDSGYEVKAFVRNPEKMTIQDQKLVVVKGDIVDAKTVDKAVEGVDAVLVALGPKPDNVLAEGTGNIISAMKKHGITRLVVESSYPMSGSPEGMEFLKALGMTEEQIAGSRPMIDDKINQEREVQESGLDWTIVRPLMLTDGERTGNYRVGEELEVKPGDNVSRADVADFMLKALDDATWSGKIVTVSY